MSDISELYQSADWKAEKHVPVIDLPSSVGKDEEMLITVTVGKQIAHPNTTEHHIGWVEVFFHPDGEKFPYLLGKFEFQAHGASAQGPNTSTVYAGPKALVALKTEKPGTVIATSYCNIHGLWTSTAELKL